MWYKIYYSYTDYLIFDIYITVFFSLFNIIYVKLMPSPSGIGHQGQIRKLNWVCVVLEGFENLLYFDYIETHVIYNDQLLYILIIKNITANHSNLSSNELLFISIFLFIV